MSRMTSAPPLSRVEPVTETLHGVSMSDPYRWLEDPDSPNTREWIREQRHYARAYLNNIAGREVIRERVRQFLAVDTFDSLEKHGSRYFFRKRRAGQEQFGIYVREGLNGTDDLLVDPLARGTGIHTSVRPLRVSPSGRLLLYEIKQGGERMGIFEILDIESRQVLPDILPRGYLRGFAFAPDDKSFCYVHEAAERKGPTVCAAYQHVLGSKVGGDRLVFLSGQGARMSLIAGGEQLGFLVSTLGERTLTSFYLARFSSDEAPTPLITNGQFSLGPVFAGGDIFAITDRDAPNFRIIELRPRNGFEAESIDIVPEQNQRIRDWVVTRDRIVVSFVDHSSTRVCVFDRSGNKLDEWPPRTGGRTLRLLRADPQTNEVVIETQSFTQPPAMLLCSVEMNRFELWARRRTPFEAEDCRYTQLWYPSKDGAQIPIYLMGRPHVFLPGPHPVIMTSYGGYGVPMTPQFSIFVAILVERGCLFALPNIRGGSEFGSGWHDLARRRNRQRAFDDFLAAAEWLISTGRTTAAKLAIFGGSNSGLLVAAALTQRPELFGSVLCMVPLLDMLRYHLFDRADLWRDEYGSADDPEDFAALLAYSPYHQVRPGVPYPPTMIVSGDADQNCNPLHARKMTARLQANSSRHPILLDYNPFRGHSPVLPLSDRIEALTDRIAFFCDQLELPA